MTAARPAIGSPCRSSGGRAVALSAPIAQWIEQRSSNPLVAGSSPAGRANCSTYGRMKLLQRISDAGSIPASSTTTGLHGFDGMNSRNGRPAMVPAASGSADESGVRCDGPNTQTPMTAFFTWRRLRDDPAARVGTKGRHLFPKALRLCEADPVATRAARRPLAGADFAAGKTAGAVPRLITSRLAGSTPAPATTYPGSARGPGVAAFKSTVAAPVFNSSNVHGCKA